VTLFLSMYSRSNTMYKENMYRTSSQIYRLEKVGFDRRIESYTHGHQEILIKHLKYESIKVCRIIYEPQQFQKCLFITKLTIINKVNLLTKTTDCLHIPGDTPGTYFCYRLSLTRALLRLEGICQSNDNIGNQTSDLKAYRTVPQPPASQITPYF
jgi:hypothetical protein